MAKGIYEYLEYAGGKLIADATIKAFCQTNFNRTLYVFVGQEESDLPSEDFCPCVIFTGGGRGLTGNDHLKTRAARAGMMIKHEAKKAATSTGVVTYPGLTLLDEFSDLISKALSNLDPHSSGYYISEVVDGPEDRIEHPIYKAWVGLSIQLDSDI